MRNKVALYIGGRRADLDDGSFILLNYTAENLTNPTIVRNSFSRQITLKGTPTNNAIFGDIYRNDRVTQYGGTSVGVDFDPTRKTPFTIYNERQEVLESGYLKLDKVTRTRRKVEYAVTLYGGLGSFLYGLSYDADGNKRTLADLDFGLTLDFTIDKAAVRSAWERLAADSSQPAKWDVINFAPAYTGLPAGEFNAGKAVVNAARVGLPPVNGDYGTLDGWTVVTLQEKVTGNEAKDLRSYLQKPVLRLRKVIEAICDPANNGGYTVNLDSGFFNDENPYWDKTWITLPMLSALNIDSQTTGGSFLLTTPGSYTIPNGGVLSTEYTFDLAFALSYAFPSGSTGRWVLNCEDDWAAGTADDSPGFYLNYVAITVKLYDPLDQLIRTDTFRVSTAQAPDYLPQMDDTFDYIDAESGGVYKNGQPYLFKATSRAYGVYRIEVSLDFDTLAWGHLRGGASYSDVWPENSYDATQSVTLSDPPANVNPYGSQFSYSATTAATVRTGATITKAALLSGQHTPAEYLLSFCKMFGLHIVTSKEDKTVMIMSRGRFYNQGTMDISGRIDRGRPIQKTPFAFDARWYLFGNAAAGDYAEYYASKYGRPYGQFRVNTGYGFDASERSITDGIIFRNAVTVLETSKYFCELTLAGKHIPSLFIGGGKYTLFKGGESKDFDIPVPVAASRVWDNTAHPMHDLVPKMQFHGKENAPMDERDTLVFFSGFLYPGSDYIALTDDTRQMLQLNGNAPCWLPFYSEYDASTLVDEIPVFNRNLGTGTAPLKTLDFGTPLEAQIPGITFPADSAIYEQYWERYISDRYDDDSAVVTCFVDLRGMKVDDFLLRRFYAFDGAVWALNRIIDYSITTFGPTKCEFVKVQDITNYTTL